MKEVLEYSGKVKMSQTENNKERKNEWMNEWILKS